MAGNESNGVMPLMGHFNELRKRLFLASAFILITSIIGWFYYDSIISTLASPICDLSLARASGSTNCGTLYIAGVLGPFALQVKVSILFGVIVGSPLWLYQLWAFVSPALHRKEKQKSIFFLLFATPFFSAGALIAYLLLPLAIKVLLGFTPDSLNNLVKFDEYLDFVLRLILIFGAAFELPVFLVSLNLIGALRGKSMLRPWRYVVFAITVFVAAFLPTADPLSMIALSAPLIILYFGAALISMLNDKRRDRRSRDYVENGATDLNQPPYLDAEN